ncbi:MAG: TonB-dependent receptor [bacterium]|nr:TonB-dependent receptor [bacterium]
MRSLIVALLASAAGAQTPSRAVRYAGLTLTEALLDLQRRGLRILFTSEVVKPEMRVTAEPTAAFEREILDQLLEPHGLIAQPGPKDSLVVVARPVDPAATGIRGTVTEGTNGRPLADVQVLIPGTGLETASAEDGTFSLPAVPPGEHSLEARQPGFVVERLADVQVVAGRFTDVSFELVPVAVPLDEIVVTPSRISLLRSDPTAVMSFDKEEIIALPHLGDELFRAFTLLPGVSGNELSASFHIRGGRSDEVLVMLDQLELFEPFHLRDFSDAQSIIAPKAIAEVDLILGGFPARFGDRMGGVLDMKTATPVSGRHNHLGVSILTAQAGGAGGFGEGKGDWLGVARYGNLELIKYYLDAEEDPEFWDAFGKLEGQLGASNRLGARVLRAEDRLGFAKVEDGDPEEAQTAYGSSYTWLTHQALLSSNLFVDSVLSVGRVDRDRRAGEIDEGEQEFVLRDERVLDVVGLKQDWSYKPGRDRHYLRWGFDLRSLDTDYDYFNIRGIEDPLDEIRSEPIVGSTTFRESFTSEQYSLYLTDKIRLWLPLTVEVGLRYDEHSISEDRDLSPRVNLVAAAGERGTVRAAWGHFFQSQRLYELQVEDGETDFLQAELTEQSALGYEHKYRSGSILSLNLYHRDIQDPRPRYENAFEPVDPFPEVAPDRIRIAPERSTARGAELFLRGPAGDRFDWWLSYTYARVEDEIEGRDVPRGIDQPHSLSADFAYRITDHWTFNLAFRYHTGWPTTAVMGELEEDDEGELEPVPVFGPLYDERLPDYHRLDLRASRQWQLRGGKLSFFVDVQNVYDRKNVSGFDIDFEFEVGVGVDDQVTVIPNEETWGGIVPSFGVEWEF